MKRKKIALLILSMSLAIGTVPYSPAYASEDADSGTEEETVEDPYTVNLVNLLNDRQNVINDRKEADENYARNVSSAESSIKNMERVKKHLGDQEEKYEGYGKLHEAKEKAQEKTDKAKELLASSAGATSTGEYKYGVELAPDEERQRETDNTFASISVLDDEVKDSDFDVDYFRGFYDLGKTREDIVKKAISEKGKISYLWGGKSLSTETPKALDCSGFVQWVYHYVTGNDYSAIGSTASVGQHYSQISRDELKPGDVGMKNPEGTCYVAADGEKFYSVKKARNCNRSHNDKLKDKIKTDKKDLKAYKKALKKTIDSCIKDLEKKKDVIRTEDTSSSSVPEPEEAAKPDSGAPLNSLDAVVYKIHKAPEKTGEDKEDSKAADDKEKKQAEEKEAELKKKQEAEEKDETAERTVERAEALGHARDVVNADLARKEETARMDDIVTGTPEEEENIIEKVLKDKDMTPSEKISSIKKHSERAIKLAQKDTDTAVNDLKSQLVDEKDVSRQTGHIGIYAGKDKDGRDTWVHCTGGSRRTVVVTTEDEYDGFKFYYSPLGGEKPMSVDDIRIKSTGPEADYEVNVPDSLNDYTGHKTFERFTAINAKSSPQYRLQQIASTDAAGFRKIQGRYLIAVGTGVTDDVGRYIDVVLENGTVIPCIVGDIKADIHTDGVFHIMTRHSRCVSEFIVDGDLLPDPVRMTGDVSEYTESWNSKVKKFIVYKDNVLK